MWHPTRRRLEQCAESLLHTHDTPERTALAFALGVTIGFSPLVGLHTILGLAFTYSVPAAVTVRVVQDERELGKGSFSPSYVTSQPNGLDCPPVCHTATTETLTLAP